MNSEIELHKGEVARTWDGKRIHTSREQCVKALAPMFVAFPNLEMSDETFNAYYMMLADLDPDKLAAAVVKACQAHEYPTHLITVAAIRKAAAIDERIPGPRSEGTLDLSRLQPSKMFRLSPEEDKRERMERLRRTKDWHYA